ncbi:MAG: hypothetical protein DMG15_04760 [Acidobacteria bacterium]|nr:MAG: hypothetical protein DMG15_04760 [Acidobacteriota bacterium]
MALIDNHDILRTNCHWRSRKDQSASEAHSHPENPPFDCYSISQPARNPRAVMGAEPFAESGACGFAGVMDEEGRRSIRWWLTKGWLRHQSKVAKPPKSRRRGGRSGDTFHKRIPKHRL